MNETRKEKEPIQGKPFNLSTTEGDWPVGLREDL